MSIAKGYKQTEVGVIPEDWEVLTLKNVLNGIADVDHYMPQTTDLGIPYIMTGDLKELVSEIDFDNCKQISLSDYKLLSKKIKNSKGDLILARYATIGTVTYVDVNSDFVVSYSCVTIKPNPTKLLGTFLFNYFKSSAFRIEVSNIINTGTQANVGIGDLYAVKIALPLITEQTAIANALSDMDALIAQTEKLIEKKKAIKQGVMQELLTGKTRLKEYIIKKGYKQTEVGVIPEDWEVMSISEVFDFYSTANFSKAQMKFDGEVGCLHYGLIHAIPNSSYNLQNGVKYFVDKKLTKYELLKEGDIIMVDASEDLIGVNKSVEISGVGDALFIAGLHTFLLRDKGYYQPNFRGAILNSYLTKSQMLRLAVGMKVFGVSKPQLKTILLPLPPLHEQIAIANALSDIDAELERTVTKLQKLKNQKQGMMQVLLTGKIRLV